jgi:signal transduction histidine kinase
MYERTIAECRVGDALAHALCAAHSTAIALLHLRPAGSDVDTTETDELLTSIVQDVEQAIATVRALLGEECPQFPSPRG